ncbi:hypothetical protein BX600DRAFT_452053 [Xylariales sp. PMI_506]|nr:hypothetical protein BX600DRAFT_452053 [Xylariales sp. PMI_506]
MDKLKRGETRLLLALGISLPFFAVRMIYTMLVCFSQLEAFDEGSVESTTLQLMLASVQEMVIVFVFLYAGLKNPSIPKKEGDGDCDEAPQTEMEGLRYRFERGDFAPNRAGILTLAVAVSKTLFRKGRGEEDEEVASQAHMT